MAQANRDGILYAGSFFKVVLMCQSTPPLYKNIEKLSG